MKEPERRPYYIDDFVFEEDPHVSFILCLVGMVLILVTVTILSVHTEDDE